MSVADTVRYYEQSARPWERQVMIRSRGCAGDIELFREFFSRIESLIFSTEESVDSALTNVRLSKEKIDLENVNKRGFDVKLGRGGIREIEFLFRDLIIGARERIVMEGQYYWSQELNDLLIEKMHQMRGKDFEIVLILADISKIKSLTRKMASYEARLLEELTAASQLSGTKLIMGTPRVFDEDHKASRPIYIHSKVLLIDDTYFSIGSANCRTW
jgi:hypothetical protein